MAKLMKPLFINGMYNKEGRRIRVNYFKTIGEYPLWVTDGKPDKDYPRAENDKYYIYIQIGEYIFTKGETEYDIIQRAGDVKLNKDWYGDFTGRQAFFDEIYKGRTYEEYNSLIKEQIYKEEVFINEHGQKEEVQAEYLKEMYIDYHINNYIAARDHNGKFADFIGALCLNELDKCEQIAKVLKAERQEQERIKQIELKKQKIKEAEEEAQAEKLLIKETEKTFINGGIIESGDIIVKLAEKYNINIPLRTKGWILNSLAKVTITEDGSINYQYWKRSKNATGSQKVFDVLRDIRSAITA